MTGCLLVTIGNVQNLVDAGDLDAHRQIVF